MICRICDSAELEPAFDLGRQPWGNHFLRPEELGTEPHYPLRLVYCRSCQAVQLDYTVRKEVMFGDHTYLSGVTRSLREHFRTVARGVDAEFFAGDANKSVLDIGSNDGTQLRAFQDLGYEVLGVESSRATARAANGGGVPTVNEFFNRDLAVRLGRTFHVISAAGVFFHLEELHSVAEGIRLCLREDGVFVVQFLYMKCILENLAFDQIYHEHLLYYTLRTVRRLLTRHGLDLFDARLEPIHGGSIVGYATHAGRRPATDRLRELLVREDESGCNEPAAYRTFARRVAELKDRNLAYLDEKKAAGKVIFGYGAPVKGNTLLNYFGIGHRHLDCVVEINPLRKGLFTPGTHLPVVMEHELTRTPDVYYVLAWNFRAEILAKNQHLLDRGVEFFFPITPPEAAP
jgi:SAM-dependent methyltransferase